MQQTNGNRMLAIIPARSGSKRLPGKNVRPLGGLPLIAWTIRAAISSGMFDDVLVSTDDPEIADISRRYGASAPWLRPAVLSTDTATSMDVVLHAVDSLETESKPVEHVVLLQPTSPFRTPETIKAGVEQYLSGAGSPVVSVSPVRTHPELCFRLDETNRMVRYCSGRQPQSMRAQDLPAAFEVNGALYAASASYLRDHQTFLGPDAMAFIMAYPVESIDIDDEWDWQLASWVASAMQGGDLLVELRR